MPICFENVYKNFGETKILNDFSFKFPKTGCVCFLGKSGIGKTTLLNLIANIKVPDLGYIKRDKNLKIAYVFQEDRLISSISAIENISIVIKENKVCNAKSWLNTVNFDGDYKMPVCFLSGGLKRKVSIARALAYEADILLLDEPFNSIDKQSEEKIIKFLKIFKKEKLIVLVTHNDEEAKCLADKIYYLQGFPLKFSL